MPILTSYIEWYGKDVRMPPLNPLSFQEAQVKAGTWSDSFLSYNSFEFEKNTFLPADYVFPAYSLAPYITVSPNTHRPSP